MSREKPTRTLLSDIKYPPGFDSDGRRCLARCPEFAVFELFAAGGKREIELSAPVERALLRAMFRVNSTWLAEEETDRRIDFALTLRKLRRFGVWREEPLPAGSVPLARAVSRTIGEEVATALDAEDVKDAVEKAAARFKNALLAVAREEGRLPDGRSKHPFPRVAELIWSAKAYFFYSLIRPKKSELRQQMEKRGLGYAGRDSNAKWREAFHAAALQDLPD